MVKLGWKKQASSVFKTLDASIRQRITDKLQEIVENAEQYPHRPMRRNFAGNFIVKPIITWTLTVGEVRNLASEGVGFGSPKVFTYIRALL